MEEKESMREGLYILYRRLKALCGSLCFYLCRAFPIRGDLISVCTFEGKGGFGCNPKYIVEELHRRNPGLQFVWFVNDMAKAFPPYIKKETFAAGSAAKVLLSIPARTFLVVMTVYGYHLGGVKLLPFALID